MSAVPPKADVDRSARDVRFVPGRDSCTAANSDIIRCTCGPVKGRSQINNGHRLTSLDQLIGAQQECFRDRQAYRLCGLEVDYEL
jgi:hypothetical protein